MTMAGAGDNTTVPTIADPLERMPQHPGVETPPRNYREAADYGRPGFGGYMLEAGQAVPTSIAAGSFPIFRPNKSRRYMAIQNLSTTAVLWIRPSGTNGQGQQATVGAPSIALNPAPAAGQGGGVYVMEGEAISLDAWSGRFSADDSSAAYAAYEL